MKEAMKSTGAFFSSRRMVKAYAVRYHREAIAFGDSADKEKEGHSGKGPGSGGSSR